MNNYLKSLLEQGRSKNRWLLKGLGAAGLILGPTLAWAQPTYCAATHGSTCTGAYIDIVEIVGTSFNNAGSGCTNTQSQAVSTFPATGSTTATLQPGQTYTFNITTTSDNIISVWIDFNQDGVFDASEHTQVSTNSTANVVNTASISIPAGATPGLTGMRVRSRAAGSPNGATDACTQFFSGETEDYTVQLGIPVPCTGTPNAGTLTANNTTTCSGGSVKLTATGMTTGGGITYQFQESNDNGVTDPWGPVVGGTGANGNVYTTPALTAGIYYRYRVTCSNSNLSATTPAVQISISSSISTFPYTETFDNVTAPALPCGWATLDTNGDTYTWVNEATNPNSPPNAMVYSYNPSGPADDWFFSPAFTFSANRQYLVTFNYRVQSASYPEKLEVRWGTAPTPAGQPAANVIWKDTNLVNTTYQIATATGFTPPANGTYYLSFHAFSAPDMWDIYVDDITIVELGPCAGTPTPGTVTAAQTALCSGSFTTLTATGATMATGITYVWEESNDNGVNDPWTTAVGGSGTNTTIFTTPPLSSDIFYRLKVTCANGSQSATSTAVGLTNTGVPCYCSANLHFGNCSAGDNIDIVEIVGAGLLNSGTGCGNTSGPAYSVFPASGTTTATLQPGATYTFNVTTTGTNIISVWIDYNRDGLFDATEHTQIATTSAPGVANTASITIPVTAMTGITGMRIRSRAAGNTNGPGDACLNFGSGETEDYFILIGTPTPCSGTPTGGTASANPQSTCLNGSSVVTVNGATNGVIGMTYQWEESDDNGAADPWTNVSAGGNPNSFSYATGPLTTSKWYRFKVTCNNSNQTSYSTATQVVVSSAPCYCNTNLHASNCSGSDHIASVSLTNAATSVLSNMNTGCNGTANNPSFSVSAATGTLVRNTTYTVSVTSGSNSTIEMWIDLNRNGIFDANLTEWKLISPSSTAGSASTATFTIPATAQLGQTGMRIRTINAADFSQATPASACNQFNSGETEDYIVTIAQGTGVAEDLSAAVSVMPNPTSGTLTLQLPAALTPGTQLKVFDANGREAYAVTSTGGLSQELNLSQLANGLYLLQTTLHNTIITKRIVVQK